MAPALAGAFVVAALAVVTGCSTGRSPVESVAPATALTPPSTVAPLGSTAAPATSTTIATPETAATVPATTVLSPLAAGLGPRLSVLPEAVVDRPEPVALTIDGLRLVGAPVVPVGIDPTGELEVPDETEVGWYRLGARPGQPGAVVLASHVSWNRKRGLFEQLGRLEPGDRAVVAMTDGSTRAYEVVERALYGKDGLPADRIWTHDGPETLVLITCGGTFNPSLRSYRDNIVVYAVPVA